MQEDRQPGRLDRLVHREERRVGELAAGDRGRHVDAAHPGERARARELGERRRREVHRQHREPDEPVRVAEMRGRGRVVVALGELLRERLVRPVHHRERQRHCVHRDALLVHRLEARVEIREPRPERIRRERAGLEDDALAFDVGDLAAAAGPLFPPERDQLVGIEVRVDVDRRVGHGRATVSGRAERRTRDDAKLTPRLHSRQLRHYAFRQYGRLCAHTGVRRFESANG